MERDKILNIIATYKLPRKIRKSIPKIIELHPRLKEYKILERKILCNGNLIDNFESLNCDSFLEREFFNLTQEGHNLLEGDDLFLYVTNKDLYCIKPSGSPSPPYSLFGSVYKFSRYLGIVGKISLKLPTFIHVSLHEIGHMLGLKHHEKDKEECYMGVKEETNIISCCDNCMNELINYFDKS